MRWSLRSEFDFVVKHRAGSKIGHADALSRHVGTILDYEIISKDKILAEQKKDSFCTNQRPGKYSSRREYFLDEDGVM
jgi:hypothetical protein